MTHPDPERRFSAHERDLFRRTFYEKNMAAFSAILWKNMVLAVSRSDEPRKVAALLAWEMLYKPALSSTLKPESLLDGAPDAFCVRHTADLTQTWRNGFPAEDRPAAMAILAERLRGCAPDALTRLLGRWAEICASNESHSGFMKLKFSLLGGGALARAVRALLPQGFDVDAVLAPVIATRNDWTHHAGEYFANLNAAQAQSMLRAQMRAAAQFTEQADPEAFRRACRDCETYCQQVCHAPFRLESLRDRIPVFDAVAPFVHAWMLRGYTHGEEIFFTDREQLIEDVKAFSAALPQGGSRESAVTSMRSGRLSYLAAAADRALRPEDVRQLVERCNVFALPSVWLDPAGAAFLGSTCVRILRAQNETRGVRRALLMDKQTHRRLRAQEAEGTEAARGAGTRRRWMAAQGDLEILPALPGAETPEESLCMLSDALPDTRFCLLMTGSDIRFAAALAKSGRRNVIPVLVGKTGSERAGQLQIIRPVWETALRCIEGDAEASGAETAQTPAPQAASHRPERPYLAPQRMPGSGAVVFTETGVPIRLGRQLGSGGEGVIYTVGASNRAAKIYHPARNTPERYAKLDWMIRHDPKLAQLCWPESLLWDADGAFVGFVMLRVPDGALPFRLTVADMARPSKNEQIMPRWDRYSLAVLCQAVCRTLSQLPPGVLMGDVNPMNFLLDVNDDSFQRFWIVDCDSFQVAPWPCPVGTAEFTGPQIYDREGDNPRYSEFLRTPADEAYAVATLLFHILVGASPYSAADKNDMVRAIRSRAFAFAASERDGGAAEPDGPCRLIWRNLPLQLRRTFETVFRDGGLVTLPEWAEQMRRYASALAAGRCDRTVLPERVFEYLREGETPRYVDFTCDFCGKTGENMLRVRFDENEKRRRPNLCRVCYATAVRMRGTPDPDGAVCAKCGGEYGLSVYDAKLLQRGFREAICPDCLTRQDYPCQTPGCTGKRRLSAYKYRELTAAGRRVRCETCLQVVETPCEYPLCENTASLPRFQRIELAQQGRRVLCKEHLESFTGRR